MPVDPSTALLEVATTVAREDEARALARALVERQLAACVRILAIDSVYRWQQAVQEEREWLLLCKTTADAYSALEAALQELHPYELPAIHAVPVARASAGFASWVSANVVRPGAGAAA